MVNIFHANFMAWLAVLILMVGCAGQDTLAVDILKTPTPTPTPEPSGRGAGDTLQIVFWDAPSILNRHLTTAVKDATAARITYEPLASFDADTKLVLYLAAEEPTVKNGLVAEDRTSVTWKLKQGVQWSDGEPFTAEDVHFTWEFIVNPEVESSSAATYSNVKDVEIIDDYTVKVIFNTPEPFWAGPFVGPRGVILPKHKFEDYNGRNARSAPANSQPVGTGPYMVEPPGIKPQEVLLLGTQLVQTNKIVFVPNPFFREEDKPYFSRIELRGGGTPKEAARLVLETGQVDYAWNLAIPPDLLTQFEAGGQGNIVTNFGSRVEQIEPNFTDPNAITEDGERSSLQFPHPLFSDLRVRQAFAHAIDRERITALYGPAGERTNHILASPPQYRSDRSFYEFDLDRAKQLLDEAGLVDNDGDGFRDKDGEKINILFQTYASDIPRETQRLIQRDLISIGIDVKLEEIPASVFFGSNISNPKHNGRFQADLQETDWTSNSPDPGSFLQFWTCDQIPQKANNWSGFNFRRWCSEEYDALYQQSTVELDPDIRQEIFIKMNDMLSEQVVTIPLVRKARISGIKSDLEGFNPTPWDSETWNISEWRRRQQP